MRPLEIGLLWHSLRSDNLGVGALTVSRAAILARACARAGRSVSMHVIGFGGDSKYDALEVTRETVVKSRRDLLPNSPIWKALARCDLVLDIGAGDSFTDMYGAKRFTWLWATKEIALFKGRPLVLAPQTIGPFTSTAARVAARSVLRRCHRTFARDPESLALLHSFGLGEKATETVDVAFGLPYTPRGRFSQGRLEIGLNVSGLLYRGGYTKNNQFKLRADYRTVIDKFIERTAPDDRFKIILVPHVIAPKHEVEDDLSACRELAGRYNQLSVAPHFSSPSEAKSFISGLDLLVGSRMHATIAAVSAGVPVVPLAYSRKFRGVFASVSYPVVGDCSTESESSLLELIAASLGRIDELREAAKSSAAVARHKLALYEDYLQALVARLP